MSQSRDFSINDVTNQSNVIAVIKTQNQQKRVISQRIIKLIGCTSSRLTAIGARCTSPQVPNLSNSRYPFNNSRQHIGCAVELVNRNWSTLLLTCHKNLLFYLVFTPEFEEIIYVCPLQIFTLAPGLVIGR